MKKRYRLLAGCLTAALLLTACGGAAQPSANAESGASQGAGEEKAAEGAAGEKTTPEDTFVYATNGEPGNLDPQNNSFLMGQIVTNCIFDTLVARDPNTGEIKPCLAESWENIDDVTIRFHLRQDVKFQNGEKLTSEDVVYTLGRMVNGAASASYYTTIDFEKCAAVDDYTVDLALKYPFAGIYNFLSNPRGGIVCKSYVESTGEDAFGRTPMGTGAFSFKEWVTGDNVTLVRNDEYWGEKPAYGNLVVRFIADSSTRFIELETGGVDACDNISGSNYTRIKNGVDHCVLSDTLSTKTFYIVMADEHEYVSDLNVRKALAYALDREAVVKAAYGESAVAADSTVAATLPFYVSQNEYYPYDPEKARQCLADAGYADGINLTLVVEEVTELVNLAEACQAYWAEAGINVDVQVYDIATAGTMASSGEAYFTIRNCGCASGDPDQCFQFFTEAYGGTNGKKDPVFNEMLDKGRAETDEKKRYEIYGEVQKYAAENMLEIPLLTPIFAYGTRDYVENFNADPSNVPDLRTVTFTNN